MGTTLQHGIFLPAEGERNCYTGLASNWTILDGVIGGYSAHAANLTIHVTAEDKQAWNGKADASALTAHTGDTTIHVTAEDKAKWDAVTGKANDADVVHKSGNETVTGNKTFSSINGVEPSALSLPSGNARDVIDISSYITDFSGTANTYTASANGWVTISVHNCTGIQAYIAGLFGDSRTRQTAGTIKFLMPIRKNQTINLQVYGGTLEHARFIPCQGNV